MRGAAGGISIFITPICGSDPMAHTAGSAAAYICPMHSDVHQALPGKCPTCGMNLVPEGARFAILRHMLGSPLHLAVMAAIMIALMAAAMMMLR
jgi:hypothetical protein